MKHRWEVINWLIRYCKYNSYLEIGVKDGTCLNRVDCAVKHGVDIKPLIVGDHIHAMSSDDFFAKKGSKYDIIFIDGDHHEKQADLDIQNSLKRLAPGGTIVMHDCNPKEKIHATPIRGKDQPLWSGTAYKSFLKLRRTEANLNMFVVDVDWGCGIIQRGKQKLVNMPKKFTWVRFDANRVTWLGLVTPRRFVRRIHESRSSAKVV